MCEQQRSHASIFVRRYLGALFRACSCLCLCSYLYLYISPWHPHRRMTTADYKRCKTFTLATPPHNTFCDPSWFDLLLASSPAVGLATCAVQILIWTLYFWFASKCIVDTNGQMLSMKIDQMSPGISYHKCRSDKTIFFVVWFWNITMIEASEVEKGKKMKLTIGEGNNPINCIP